MNDLDVFRNLTSCVHQECNLCDYHENGCTPKLLKDARNVIKMQTDALNGFSEQLAKLKEENAQFAASFKYDEKKLVEAVNDIIYACMDDFDDYDDGGNAYRRMVEVILKFGGMLPGEYKVEIVGINRPPKLVKA